MEKIKHFVEINNMDLVINEESHSYICHKPWGEECLLFDLSMDIDTSLLEQVILPKRLIALKHITGYEFIFMPMHESILKDLCCFDFVFEGKTFHAEYRQASKVFEILSRSIKREQYEETDYNNVFMFKAFYQDVDEDKTKEEGNKISSGYQPINFYVEGDFSGLEEEEHYKLFRHINFYMQYYNRKCPEIILRDEKRNEDLEFQECNLSKTPAKINSTKIDDTLLLLIESARSASSTRLQYIFYYQVLEYCAYYYLDENFKHKIHNLVESPSFFADMDASINALIDEFQDNYNNKSNSDTQRLERVLMTYLRYESIKTEIAANEEYFRKDCQFDGGFLLPALLGNQESIDTGSQNLYKNIRARIENLRNVLVHVRESRESKTISPTPRNSNLLKPYLYLIRRIAEELATRNY